MGAQSYLLGLIGFLAFIAIFGVLLQLPMRIGWFTLEMTTGVIVHILTSIAGYAVLERYSYFYQAALYAFLWFCFFFVTSIYSASVSVGIINYLYKQRDHTASLEDVYQSCIVPVFRERIDFLLSTKQIQETSDGYTSTSTGKRTARQLRKISKVLGMQNQAFYTSDPMHLKNQDPTNKR